jgi:hypothetical protein
MYFNEKNNLIISDEEIIQIFSFALRRFVKDDIHMLKSNVQERALQFRLASYLREYFIFAESGGLNIDVEYNRDGANDIKKIKPDNLYREECSTFYPDILLHERGSADYDNGEKHKNNIIYCEIKKNGKSGNDDAKRVILQMKERNYQYGINLYSLKENDIRLDLYTVNNIGHIGYKFDTKSKKLVKND